MTEGAVSLPPDHEDRLLAATDFDHNIVVVAGAGTGKTSLLVERVLTAVGSGRVGIGEIGAITFTEKAAGEMRQRLATGLERLLEAARGEVEADPGEEADRALDHLLGRSSIPIDDVAARALEALRELDRSRVETIHTFCAGLLREFPVEVGVQPDFVVDTGEMQNAVHEELWERFVARELGQDARRGDLWRRVLGAFSMEHAEALASALASYSIPEAMLSVDAIGYRPGEILGEQVDGLIAALQSILDRQSGMKQKGEDDCRAMVQALEALLADGPAAFAKIHDAHKNLVTRAPNSAAFEKKKSYGEVSGRELNRIGKSFETIGKQVLKVRHGPLRDLLEAVLPFAVEAREELLRRGYVTFDGLLVLARDLLRDHPDVRRRLKQRFRMLLVDEFQDTDPLQYEIVLYLGERTEDDATDAYDTRLEPGRLFVVGDPKQSIYRFRGADYDAFRRAVGRILDQDGRRALLTANFRSVPGVISAVNVLFDAKGTRCWERSDYQPDYEPIDAVRPDDGVAPAVEVWTVDAGENPLAGRRREAEGRVIAEWIRSTVDPDEPKYDKITILLRAFTQLADYLRPLRQLGIPFVVDGGREFLARPEVAHLLVILKVLARPSDAASLLAYLRSPLGAVTDAELAAYASAEHSWSWLEEADPEKFPDVARGFAQIRELAASTRDAPADEVVRKVLAETDLLTLSAAAFEGPQRVANLTKLAAAAAELAREGRLSLIEVVEALEEGRTSLATTDSPLADEATDAVRVMTIHKAKGLENDIVILPDLARDPSAGHRSEEVEARTVRLAGGGESLAVKVDDHSSLAWARHVHDERWHGEAEEVRVLYVGMTRARERLILIAAPSRREAPWVKALGSLGYSIEEPGDDGSTLLDGRVLHLRRVPGADERESGHEMPSGAPDAVESYRKALKRMSDAGPPIRTPSQEERWKDDGSSGVREFADRDTAKAVGIATHLLLERWDGRDDATLLEMVTGVSKATADEAGVEPGVVEREVREIFVGFIASELRGRLREVEVLGREIPIVEHDEEGRVYRGTLDLLYKDVDGEYVVADYKTDRETDPAALDEAYGPQLSIYARAVQRALSLPSPPRRELWLLRTATLHTLR